MAESGVLTESELKEFAVDWYKKLDVHASADEYAPLLAADVELRFPEATVKGVAGFNDWYFSAINSYFDEVHIVKQVKLTSSTPEQSEVKVVVKWEASLWKPPAATSERVVLDAYQTWIVKRSPQTNQPVIALYIVDEFQYYEGSFKL